MNCFKSYTARIKKGQKITQIMFMLINCLPVSRGREERRVPDFGPEENLVLEVGHDEGGGVPGAGSREFADGVGVDQGDGHADARRVRLLPLKLRLTA